MSFTIAVLPPDHSDLVFCSEGKELALIRGYTKVTEETTFPVRENFLKTLALSPKLCIGFGGFVAGIRQFLEKLLPSLPWEECAPADQPTNFIDSIAPQRKSSLLDISAAECCDKIAEILARLGLGKQVLPIIGGEDNGKPCLYYTKFLSGKYLIVPTQIAYGAPLGFAPSAQWPSVDHIINQRIACWPSLGEQSVEQRCLEIVELVADHAFTCNKNITFRRLSQGFVQEGREVVSSLLEPNPSS